MEINSWFSHNYFHLMRTLHLHALLYSPLKLITIFYEITLNFNKIILSKIYMKIYMTFAYPKYEY